MMQLVDEAKSISTSTIFLRAAIRETNRTNYIRLQKLRSLLIIFQLRNLNKKAKFNFDEKCILLKKLLKCNVVMLNNLIKTNIEPKNQTRQEHSLTTQQRKFFTSFNKLIFNGFNLLCVILVDVHFSILQKLYLYFT